jgi:hypothetical protein
MKRFLLITPAALIVLLCPVFYKCSQPDYVKRYDKPLTYSQAIKEPDIDFPLPASSSDIYYGMYADWQAYTSIVRFKAPVEDCINHIDKVIAWNDRTYKRKSSFPRTKVTHVDRQGAGWLEPATWFCPETITNGLYLGDSASHIPQIWIDLDKGIFYFTESD